MSWVKDTAQLWSNRGRGMHSMSIFYRNVYVEKLQGLPPRDKGQWAWAVYEKHVTEEQIHSSECPGSLVESRGYCGTLACAKDCAEAAVGVRRTP